MNELLLGWDYGQWAVAIERVGLGGTRMLDADRCRAKYIREYGQNPLEFQLIGVSAGGNFDLASALFEQLEYSLEGVNATQETDSSYGDHSKDDHDYDEGRKNIWERGV
jgi:hypothetical protein